MWEKIINKFMKKYFSIFTVVLAFTFASCSNELDYETEEANIPVSSVSMSSEEFNQLNQQIMSLFESADSTNITRGAAQVINNPDKLTEAEAKTIMQPFALEGKILMNSIIAQSKVDDSYKLSAQEITKLKNLSDADLALYAYFVEYVNNNPEIIKNNPSAFLDCALSGAGLSFINGMSNYTFGTIMLAKTTGVAMAKWFVTRTVGGWITAAYGAYKFAECMKDKSASNCPGIAVKVDDPYSIVGNKSQYYIDPLTGERVRTRSKEEDVKRRKEEQEAMKNKILESQKK